MCTEREVSICAKDSGGPYNYEIVSHLVQLAKENNIGFAVDVYPHYGSDVETTLRAGNDIRHALIGPVCMLPMAMNEATEMGQKTPSA